MRSLPRIVLKPGHVLPVWAGHPWVYAQAIGTRPAEAATGDQVAVFDPQGNFLGSGLYSSTSKIPVRIVTRDPGVIIDSEHFELTLRAAVARRQALGLPNADTDVFRLVHSEGDLLAGVILDRLGDTLAVQFTTDAIAPHRATLLEVCRRVLGPLPVFDRSPSKGPRPPLTHVSGVEDGNASAELHFRELGVDYTLPASLTQKTGFYADQRQLRQWLQGAARGKRVLDTFCYVGACGVAAARAGACYVVGVDSSGPAIEAAAAVARANGVGNVAHFVHSPAATYLQATSERFDLVVCDPPKLAPNRGAQSGAERYLRKLVASACRVLDKGGLLVLCSCSARVGSDALARAIALGTRDQGRQAWVRERLFQSADHPTLAAFPEGLYLSTVIAEIQ